MQLVRVALGEEGRSLACDLPGCGDGRVMNGRVKKGTFDDS